jgi:hypothetical protein
MQLIATYQWAAFFSRGEQKFSGGGGTNILFAKNTKIFVKKVSKHTIFSLPNRIQLIRIKARDTNLVKKSNFVQVAITSLQVEVQECASRIWTRITLFGEVKVRLEPNFTASPAPFLKWYSLQESDSKNYLLNLLI